MLVAAGLESKTTAEIADCLRGRLPRRTRRSSTSCRPTSSRGRRSTSTTCSRSPNGSRTPAMPTPLRAGNVYYAVDSFADYGQLSGNTLDRLRAGHRARSRPTSAIRPTSPCGRPPARGAMLKLADGPLGRGLPGLAPRVLGDGAALPRARPSRSTPAGSTTSSPTTRTRSPSRPPLTGGPPARYWVHGEHLLAEGRKMAKSAGNFERITELAGAGHRSARLPLPRPDRPLQPQARTYSDASLDGGRRRRWRRCGPGCGRSARPCATVRGPPRRSSWPGRPATGRRASRRVSPGTARSRAAADSPGRSIRARPRGALPEPCPPPGPALHERFVAAVDDDLDMPTGARRRPRDAPAPPARRRASLARPRRRCVLGLDLDRAWAAAGADRSAEGATLPDTSGAPRVEGARPERRATSPGPTPLRVELLDLGFEVVDRPDGSTARPLRGLDRPPRSAGRAGGRSGR